MGGNSYVLFRVQFSSRTINYETLTMKMLVAKFPGVFQGIGLAKVNPIHIKVDHNVKPIQQKPRQITVHYAQKFKD